MSLSHRKIKAALNRGLNASLPDVLGSVLQAEISEMTVEEYNKIMSNTAVSSKPATVKANARPATILLRPGIIFTFIAAFLGLGLWSYLNPAALIAIDVNPSFEVATNIYQRVIKISGLDQNAQQVLHGLKLKNKPLGSTMETLVGSLIDNGYLEHPESTILVTVASSNETRSKNIEDQIVKDFNQVLGTENNEVIIFTQIMQMDEATEAGLLEEENDLKEDIILEEADNLENDPAAEEKIPAESGAKSAAEKEQKQPAGQKNENKSTKKISFGKAVLIKKLKERSNVPFSENELAKMSMKEIKMLLDKYDTDLQTILSNGHSQPKEKKNKDNSDKQDNQKEKTKEKENDSSRQNPKDLKDPKEIQKPGVNEKKPEQKKEQKQDDKAKNHQTKEKDKKENNNNKNNGNSKSNGNNKSSRNKNSEKNLRNKDNTHKN